MMKTHTIPFDLTQVVSSRTWEDRFKAVNIVEHFRIRGVYTAKVGFPILTDEVATLLAKGLKGKLAIEVGCGSGYLAHTLNTRGATVIPVDSYATSYARGTGLRSFENAAYCSVLCEDATKIDLSGYAVVIMSWPDHQSDFAVSIAKNMKVGQYLVYQGEDEMGCTATEDFFTLLGENFKFFNGLTNVLSQDHVQFMGIHDYWHVYRKIKE